MSLPADDRPLPVEHYENFPVASWLCPPQLRRPIASIYWFARTADDIADEGNATAGERLQDLFTYGNDLSACLAGNTGSGRWAGVLGALGAAARDFHLVADVRRLAPGRRRVALGSDAIAARAAPLRPVRASCGRLLLCL